MGLFKVTNAKRNKICDGIKTADYLITKSSAIIGVTSVVAYAMAPVISTIFHIQYNKITDVLVKGTTLCAGYLAADALIENDTVRQYVDRRSREFADDVTDLLFDEEEETAE